MKILKTFFPLILGFLFLSSCGPKLTPFTQQLYDDQNWSEAELKRIQFYTSQDILLYRELSKGESKIVSGEIKIRNGKKVDEVLIRKGTPGVLLFRPKDDKFAISFESDNDDRFLIFGASRKRGGRYRLLAKDWERNYGKITYEGRVYTTRVENPFPILMVDLKRHRKTEVKSRVAKGRKID